MKKPATVALIVTVNSQPFAFEVSWPWLHRTLGDNFASVSWGEHRLTATPYLGPKAKPRRKRP